MWRGARHGVVPGTRIRAPRSQPAGRTTAPADRRRGIRRRPPPGPLGRRGGSVLAELGPLRAREQRRVEGALRDLEGGVAAAVLGIVDELHLEALRGAVDRADRARQAECHPTLLDCGAVAHDLLLRLASICVNSTL